MIPAASALTEITRIRVATGTRDATGCYVDGATVETALLASVQPVDLADVETMGGEMLSERVKVFALQAEVVAAHGDRLAWGGDVLLWGADALRWAASGGLTDTTAPVLAAAFSDSDADRVRLADGRTFVVESSMAWPSHTEATLLRET